MRYLAHTAHTQFLGLMVGCVAWILTAATLGLDEWRLWYVPDAAAAVSSADVLERVPGIHSTFVFNGSDFEVLVQLSTRARRPDRRAKAVRVPDAVKRDECALFVCAAGRSLLRESVMPDAPEGVEAQLQAILMGTPLFRSLRARRVRATSSTFSIC